ncbi:hypothetical protein FACS1894130_12970 [Spirochaetia bacterium]|nr:hypothetical protein FACS1894130_12970 [Spirochaetia bacterium]
MTVQGVPAANAPVENFLKPIHEEREKRNRLMTAKLNEILREADLPSLDYENSIRALSMAHEGGSVTERHILYALSLLLVKQAGRGQKLLELLSSKLSIPVGGKMEALLRDAENPYYEYDLLGVLKTSIADKIFIQPNESECPPVETVTKFARDINAFPLYAYLGDVGESPTGDKKAEKFEDDYLEDLIPCLKPLGFLGVTYMPPRNTKAQLLRLQGLCRAHELIEVSGVDINSPRHSFNCPGMRMSEFAHLGAATWKLVEHEKLANKEGNHEK